MAYGILKMVSIADLHFGNPRINAEDQYKKLRKFFYPELKDAHLITVNGDLYDQLLTVNSKSHHYATRFITDLIAISAKTGAQVRLLHGTFTHDRDQLSIFSTLNVPKARFAVVNDIFCEELCDFQNGNDEYVDTRLRVAYLPDNLPYKRSDDAIEKLKQVMSCVGWGKIDVVIGHGAFDYIFNTEELHRPPCLYRYEQFTDLVTGIVVMGHIHTPGRRHNVYYCGSFDRMAHGEEENKGFYTFTRDKENLEGWRSRFVVNTLSTPFITIHPEGNDTPETTRNFIREIEERFPLQRGYVRVEHDQPEVRSLLHKLCVQNFPNISYSSKATGTKREEEIRVEDITLDIFDDVVPDEHNLGELIVQFLTENNMLENIPRETIIERTKMLLNE